MNRSTGVALALGSLSVVFALALGAYAAPDTQARAPSVAPADHDGASSALPAPRAPDGSRPGVRWSPIAAATPSRVSPTGLKAALAKR